MQHSDMRTTGGGTQCASKQQSRLTKTEEGVPDKQVGGGRQPHKCKPRQEGPTTCHRAQSLSHALHLRWLTCTPAYGRKLMNFNSCITNSNSRSLKPLDAKAYQCPD
ncbi:hypothetical protein CANTEDRAFT_114175, partial [Yamadazyma tenuis ATCC 10573]